MTRADDRYERILRDQARIADGEGDERGTLAADALRQYADDFRTTMSSVDLSLLEGMTDDEMRASAASIGLRAFKSE
jgi:hypothetical protein